MIIWTGGSPHIKGLPHLPGPPPPLPPLHLNVNTPQVCKQFGKVYKVPNSLNLTTNCIFENYAAEGHRFLIPLARIKFPLVQYIVHNYSFIYLVNYFFIYLFIGNPFTNNFVCCQNNWENMITRDKGLRKKSNDLTVCFPGKSETKPKPNLTHCHCKRTPVHFWLTSVFCFSLSFFFFLCSLLLEFFVSKVTTDVTSISVNLYEANNFDRKAIPPLLTTFRSLLISLQSYLCGELISFIWCFLKSFF